MGMELLWGFYAEQGVDMVEAMEEAKVNKVALGGRCWFEVGSKVL